MSVDGRNRYPRKWRGPNIYTDSIPDVVYGCDKSLNNLCTPNPNHNMIRRDESLDFPESKRPTVKEASALMVEEMFRSNDPFPQTTRTFDAGRLPGVSRGHGRRFRGYKGRGTSVVYLDRAPDIIYDCPRTLNGICYPEFEEAGDILPTFVSGADAQRYIDEVDAGYNRLDTGINTSSNLTQDFKTSWGIQLTAWKAFAIASKASLGGWTGGFFNAKAIMDQTDRFNEQLKNWYAEYAKSGGTGVGPAPVKPGQGIPGDTQVSDITKLVVAGGVLAAILVIGPKIFK